MAVENRALDKSKPTFTPQSGTNCGQLKDAALLNNGWRKLT